MTDAEREMNRGLNALFLEAPESVVRDVTARVAARVDELQAQLRALREAARALVDACNLTTVIEPPEVDRAIDKAMNDVEDALA